MKTSTRSRPMCRRAFTLIELLVVVAIIAILISILLPSLAAARRTARLSVCMSNQRQFGYAILIYQQEHRSYLPTEGQSDGDTASNPLGPWNDASFWPNVLPPMISPDHPSYYQMQQLYLDGQGRLPSSKTNSVFVCPEAGPATYSQTPAEVDGNGHFIMWGFKPGTKEREKRPTYWSYVYNSGLDNLMQSGNIDEFGTRHLKIDAITRTGEVPILVETLMSPTECSPTFMGTRLNRAKTKGNDWDHCRLSARHKGGGNLVFLDGHVRLISRAFATTDLAEDGTYNRPGVVVWQPN